jgi:hypothetical protein
LREAEHVTVHQHVDWKRRDGYEAAPGKFDDRLPRLRQRELVLVDQVRTPCGDGRGGVSGQRPLPVVEAVAVVRTADRVGRLIREEFRRQPVLERQQEIVRRRLRRMRMIHNDQVEPLRELCHRGVGERLQRTLFPNEVNVGMQFLKALGGGHDRREAAGVVPGDAAKKHVFFSGTRAFPDVL